MIKFGEEFAINVPSKVLLNHTQWLGMVSNTIGDKLEASGVPTFKGKEIDSPLLEGCIGWIECTLHDFYTMGDHTLFIGKVRIRPGRHRRLRLQHRHVDARRR